MSGEDFRECKSCGRQCQLTFGDIYSFEDGFELDGPFQCPFGERSFVEDKGWEVESKANFIVSIHEGNEASYHEFRFEQDARSFASSMKHKDSVLCDVYRRWR